MYIQNLFTLFIYRVKDHHSSSCIQLAFLRMVLIKSEKGNGPLCHTINMNWNNWEGTHKYYDRAADSWQWCSKTIKNIKLSIYVFNWQQLKVTSKHRISYLLDGWCYIYFVNMIYHIIYYILYTPSNTLYDFVCFPFGYLFRWILWTVRFLSTR